MPGLKCSRHPGSGPVILWIASAVPNERPTVHGEGFNFLVFASSLHAIWPIGGRLRGIVILSFKSAGGGAAIASGNFYHPENPQERQAPVLRIAHCREPAEAVSAPVWYLDWNYVVELSKLSMANDLLNVFLAMKSILRLVMPMQSMLPR